MPSPRHHPSSPDTGPADFRDAIRFWRMSIRSRSSRPTPQGPEQRTVALDHPDLPEVTVRVRRNRRARHVRLHVDEQGEVTASVPARFSAARLDPIVRERGEWLHDVLTRMALKSRDTEVDLERGDPVR